MYFRYQLFFLSLYNDDSGLFCWVCRLFSYLRSSSKWKAPNGLVGLPSHVSQGFSCQLRGQNCYVEVTLGCTTTEPNKSSRIGLHSTRSVPKNHTIESLASGKVDHRSFQDHVVQEKTIIYPAEAVLVPVLQPSLTRSSLKRFGLSWKLFSGFLSHLCLILMLCTCRFWLQNWLGPSMHGSSFMHWLVLFSLTIL